MEEIKAEVDSITGGAGTVVPATGIASAPKKKNGNGKTSTPKAIRDLKKNSETRKRLDTLEGWKQKIESMVQRMQIGLISSAAVIDILFEKGVITQEEFEKAAKEVMERQKREMAKAMREQYPDVAIEPTRG
jgi:hypothetical protein